MTWPTPFGGITHSVTFHDVEAVSRFLTWVANGCAGADHMHNIAVQFDAERPRVHGSKLLAECATRWSETWGYDL